jgi:hypothetical protein
MAMLLLINYFVIALEHTVRVLPAERPWLLTLLIYLARALVRNSQSRLATSC